MKRFAVLLLSLFLLSACGQIAPEPETEAPTEIITTAEAETTIEATFAPISGQRNMVKWRTLDVNSDEGREATQWLANQWKKTMRGSQSDQSMGKDKKIVTEDGNLVLRENAAGKKTVLLEKTYLGEATTPEEASLHEEAWKYPSIIQALDDRYFVYCWSYWEGSGQPGVYDTKNLRAIPIEYDAEYMDGDWVAKSQMIFADALYLSEGSYDPHCGPLRLMRVDLNALPALQDGEGLPAVNVLEDIPGVEDVQDMNSRFVTRDERWFLLNDMAGVRVYDLRHKKLALRLPASVFGPGVERMDCSSVLVPRDNRVYWTDYNGAVGSYLAEITLP